jgi:hypothetical protein
MKCVVFRLAFESLLLFSVITVAGTTATNRTSDGPFRDGEKLLLKACE